MKKTPLKLTLRKEVISDLSKAESALVHGGFTETVVSCDAVCGVPESFDPACLLGYGSGTRPIYTNVGICFIPYNSKPACADLSVDRICSAVYSQCEKCI